MFWKNLKIITYLSVILLIAYSPSLPFWFLSFPTYVHMDFSNCKFEMYKKFFKASTLIFFNFVKGDYFKPVTETW